MLENVKAVHNPLTIIAIFAALAEVAGTVALGLVDRSLQFIFVWFVMGFPILLVLLFFATLNFNRMVLYAPSDFTNEENFMDTLVGARSVSMNLNLITKQIEATKQEILDQAAAQATSAGAHEYKKFSESITNQLNAIESRLASVRHEAQEVASNASTNVYPHSALQARILNLLADSSAGLTRERIATELGMSTIAISRALNRLAERSLITFEGGPRNPNFQATKLGVEVGSNA